MTTNNHPAHGPVSLDRLHQIREHLLHDTQYSNGGNRAYILADMLKLVDEVLAGRNAEPVVLDEDPRDAFERSFKMPKHVTRCGTGYAVTEYSAWLAHDFIRMWEGWNACRSTMLQAANSPVTPDGWVACSERMPEKGQKVFYYFDIVGVHAGYYDGDNTFVNENGGGWLTGDVTHWMEWNMPEAPQEVK